MQTTQNVKLDLPKSFQWADDPAFIYLQFSQARILMQFVMSDVIICFSLLYSLLSGSEKGKWGRNISLRHRCLIRNNRSLGLATWEGKLSVYLVNGRGRECPMNICVSVFV